MYSSAVVAIAVVFAIYLGGSFRPKTQEITVNKERSTATSLHIKTLEDKVQSSPSNASLRIQLTEAYLQKVRETADTQYYVKAEKNMEVVTKLEPNNPEIAATKASIAYGRHDFKSGLVFAKQALALNPNHAAYHGLVGDGEVELGNYPEAVTSFQDMVNIRPDLSSFNRVAYVRELYGDIEGAQNSLQSAAKSGSSFSENVAYTYSELGKLYIRSDLDKAENSFNHSLEIVPNYEPALEGLGKVAFARNDYNKAKGYFERALDSLPIAQYALDSGDTFLALGTTQKANQSYQLARLAYERSEAAGVDTDLEMALFLADHTTELDLALNKAESAHRNRPNIFAADTLSWVYYKRNDITEAKKYSLEALRLGEHDPLILFHAGMIANKNNELQEARKYIDKALKVNPYFSLQYAATARDILKNP